MTVVKDTTWMLCIYCVSKLYKIVFLSFKSHGYQLYNAYIYTHSSCPCSSLRPKNISRGQWSEARCTQVLSVLFFWGRWWCWIFVVPNMFPSSSQHVPQVCNVFFNMFSIVHCFIPYPLPLSSTFVTYMNSSKEEITTYLFWDSPKLY